MHGKVSLSRLLANRHRTALGLNKSLLFPCKGQFLPMIKASQWIQELLSSWSGGAREISRTCTSFTLAADTSLCVWCQRDLTSLKKKKYSHAQIRLLQIPAAAAGQGTGGIVAPQPSVSVLCPRSGQFPQGTAPAPGALRALLGRHAEPQAGSGSAQAHDTTQPSPATSWNNTQPAGVTNNEKQGEGKQTSSKIVVNKRLIKSLLLLSLVALDESL